MADLNFSALCSTVERWKHEAPGGNRRWHNFWVLTALPNDQIPYGDQQVLLEGQKLFLEIRVGDSESQQKILHAVKARLNDQRGAYFIATDGTIDSYFSKKKNQEVFKLRVGLSNFRAFNEPRQPENCAILCGRVTSVNPGWIQVEERYRNPKGQGQDAWRSRKVWVYTGVQMNFNAGDSVYVRGRIANKTPDGQEMLYVVAEKIT